MLTVSITFKPASTPVSIAWPDELEVCAACQGKVHPLVLELVGIGPQNTLELVAPRSTPR